MSRSGSHFVVVGGGVTGAFAAYFLARTGAEVTLIERDGVAAHASGCNPGGLNPLHGPGIPGPLQELARQSFELHLESWDGIGELSGMTFGARRVDRIHVALDERDTATLAELAELHEEAPGFSGRLLTRAEVLSLERRVTPGAAGGLLATGNACVDAGAYTSATVRAAERLGARVRVGEAVGLRCDGTQANAVAVDGGDEIRCDGVFVAPGVSTTEWLGFSPPIAPVKGELLLAAAGGLEADVSWRHVGAYQAGEGRIWLGGTEDDAGFDSQPTSSGRERILAGVAALLPGLTELRVVDHRASLRPATPDGLPVIGLVPGFENVCFAGGAGRKGMLLGAGLGRAASDLLVEGETRLAIDGFALDRPPVAA
jgi:glycine oxidase